LILEDLSEELWPPPWTSAAVEAVRKSLNELAEVKPPPGLPPLENLRPLLVDSGWPAIAADPQPFLSLGLCTADWLQAALPKLTSAAESIELGGQSLVHVDIRSDNLCIRDGRALFIDWNWASVGNPLLDLAAWLPSLEAEGGPSPEELMPGESAAPYAASFAGVMCARAGLAAPPELPRLRELQLLQARPALAWAARALGLPPPA
jgi:aminoglycoside phosphotransferase (APT) family kinase protein